MTTNNAGVSGHTAFRILVPLDGSELAARALPVAERLAGQLGADLHLVQVLPFAVVPYVATAGYLPGEFYQQVDANQLLSARSGLEREAATAHQNGVASVHIHVERGETAATLIELSASLHVGLIVMTTHGRTGFSRLALGSVADQVVRVGAVPVLLIRSLPAGEASYNLQRALVPLDGSTLSEKALDVTVELAGAVIREITLLRAVDSHDGPDALRLADAYLETVRDRLIGLLGGRQCRINCLVQSGSPAQCIVESARPETKVVIMATRGEVGVERWVTGSTADQVLRDAHTPLMLVHSARN
ncbi:MAG: universal stress protein [Ktedonobacterales bacterium]